MKLKNTTIIVTGSNQGLGKCLAFKLAKKGANILLLARTESLLKKTKAELIKIGIMVDYFVCDIRDLKQIKQTVKNIKAKYNKIDVLVNNAGVWTDENLEKKKPELRQNALLTNALGHINFTYELLPILKEQKQAHIVNVISTAGASDIPSSDNTLWKTYGASKWANVRWTPLSIQKIDNA